METAVHQFTEGSCPLNADPAQRHHRANEALALTHGSEEPDSRMFRARRVNGPVSPTPPGIPKGSSVPQRRGRGSERCSSASLELMNWKCVLSVLGEAEGVKEEARMNHSESHVSCLRRSGNPIGEETKGTGCLASEGTNGTRRPTSPPRRRPPGSAPSPRCPWPRGRAADAGV